MKITNLLEMTTPSSDPSNMGGSQAPKFGRDPHVLEDDKIEETTAGSISTGEPTNMGMQTRGKGSMFQGIKTSKKFVNSPVTEAEKDPEQEKIDTLRRSRQEKERGSERELGRDPKPTGQYYIMINGTTYKKDGEAVMFNSSMEAHRATERISAFRKSKGWGTARYEVIQQKGMEEALDPKAMSALKQAKQSIAKNREADVASWEQDFRKNFAAKYGMPPVLAHRPLNIPSAKSATKPLEKHSVLKNRMAKLNRVIDNQKYLDYLTFKAEQKGLLNPRLAADIDTSLYVKGAEKDDYEALSQKIDKSIDLLKNRLGINKLAYKKPKTMREEGNDPYKPEPYDEFASDTYGDNNPEDDQGVAEGSEQRWRVTVGNKSGTLSHTKTFTGTKEQAIKQAVTRFATTRNPVVTAELVKQDVAETELDEAKAKKTVEDIFIKGKKVGSITTTTTKSGMTFYTAQVGNSFVAGPDTREEALKHLKRLYRDSKKQDMTEGVAETLPMDDAVKVLRQYGADHFKTTSNELHFYKQGRLFSVDLVMNPDSTRSVTLSSLNSATRGLKGQGVAEGTDVMEADLSEEHIMAKDLFKRFDLFKQGKDRALGNKPADKEIMAKEGQLTAERLPKEYIEKAIYKVLMKAYPEVINQYGAPIVSDAISSVADMHKDIENIEAEEASIMLHQVISQLKRHLQMREEKQRLDPKCWKGYKKQGTKMKGGVKVNNCVPK